MHDSLRKCSEFRNISAVGSRIERTTFVKKYGMIHFRLVVFNLNILRLSRAGLRRPRPEHSEKPPRDNDLLVIAGCSLRGTSSKDVGLRRGRLRPAGSSGAGKCTFPGTADDRTQDSLPFPPKPRFLTGRPAACGRRRPASLRSQRPPQAATRIIRGQSRLRSKPGCHLSLRPGF